MKNEDRSYLYLILFHVVVGALGYLLPFTAKIYGYSIFIFGIYYIVKKQNRNNEALIAAAYVVGSEVFLRMTGGNPLYEISKYGVVLFVLIGMYYSGFSKGAIPYWIFLLLLIPGVIISTFVLNFDTNIRKAIAFNLSGPVCLGLASLYTFRRKIGLDQMNTILLSMGLPIISCVAYLIFYTPDLQEVITGTESNFQTSGGYGPNQVATVLGLGMFIFFSRVILDSKTKFQIIINLILALNITYRGIITFSRGGMITGFLMIVLLLAFLYFKSNFGGRAKLNYIIVFLVFAMFVTWTFTSFQTGGLIDKRYANQDAAGRAKESQFTGREDVALNEINTFLKNPIFGVGVGKGVEVREDETGIKVLSHDEITRMLAEHGSLGIIALLILFFTPLVLYLENKFNMFLLCFVAFWFLTINHAAMRTAAPAFVYSLSLLNVQLGSPRRTSVVKEE
ncbi:O-antigen ligase domain-containing protein [Flavobacterium sp. GSP27]|uniref:O-antigen ligase family protein n=1 Tax=unclassified Flavobacterium TaxID=196869 RepID=UPI000F8254F3|nr:MULTISPECIES: O-antigen ligase family protein [unclassified Flavobacterium]RTY71252.1 O-antigen ligase domain-containing protein [Flavobacterium sp. LB2P53]RTY72857.1 O-antigen ligase domain-containing protein [Flavobacterium sp. LS1R10]RTY81379.1 O-antigen ligase domain-containing protein [Flavobacterium sp. LS1P28]RTY93168.1 O-antigen ligase domain-containing protein [Flavobacterium sp. RSP46]RTZ08664.1 O-antigen ligase domain-containing protein [Flavobacterium sp. GSP6]